MIYNQIYPGVSNPDYDFDEMDGKNGIDAAVLDEWDREHPDDSGIMEDA